jgi:hypothetical protein
MEKLPETRELFEKFYDMRKEHLPKTANVFLHNQLESKCWTPSGREGSVMVYHSTNLSMQHTLYVYGGMNQSTLNEIAKLKIDYGGEVRWDKLCSDLIPQSGENSYG